MEMEVVLIPKTLFFLYPGTRQEYFNFDLFRRILGFNVMLKSLTQRKVFQDADCLSSLITIFAKFKTGSDGVTYKERQ